MEQKDLLRLFRPLKKGWLLIVGMALVAVFIAQNISTYQQPIYESKCLIKLDDTYSGFSDNNLYQDLDIFAENNDVATEIEVIKSDTILKKALSKLNSIEYHRIGRLMELDIYKDHPFHLIYDSLSFRDYDELFYVEVLDSKSFRLEKGENSIKANFGEAVIFEGNELKLELSKDWIREHTELHLAARYSFRLCSPDYLLKSFVEGNLLVKEATEHVRVIRIYFEGKNSERVAVFTNAVATSYLEDHIEHKMTAANLTEDFLDERISEATYKLDRAERALENFRLNNKVLNIVQETETDLRKISQLEIQLTNLNMKLVVLDSLLKYVQLDLEKFLQLAPSYESYGGMLFTELVKQLKALEEEKIELKRKYATGSDELLTNDKKIWNLVNYIQENIDNHRKNSYAQLGKIENDIKKEKKALESVPTIEKNLKRLERDFNNYQELYNFLTKKRLEAGIAKRAKLYFHRILSKAKIAEGPVNPSKWFFIILAIFISILVSVFLLYFRDFLLGKIWEVESLRDNIYSQSTIIEEADSRSFLGVLGVRLISFLKRQKENSQVLAFCPSNAYINFTQELTCTKDGLYSSGERILTLYWNNYQETEKARESRFIGAFLAGDLSGTKLKSLLKGQRVLEESVDIGEGIYHILGDDFTKRFEVLKKHFDRIIFVLPPPQDLLLLELLEPFFDTLCCVFQKGRSKKREISYYGDISSNHSIDTVAILLEEEKRQWIPSFAWFKKPRHFWFQSIL
ncbi:MAG: Wzz/FepE/Etk N-terminal domain-containing protein, partial [Bacteroidota bacterium]